MFRGLSGMGTKFIKYCRGKKEILKNSKVISIDGWIDAQSPFKYKIPFPL